MKPTVTSERCLWLIVGAVFGLLTVAVYFPVATGKIPFPRDILFYFPAWWDFPRPEPLQPFADIGDLVTSFYPFRGFAAAAIGEGTLPLWNPHLLSGSPFLANAQSALFYPLNAVYYILPLDAAWTAAILIRMFLAALFMAILARSIGATACGTILAGTIFALCGFMTAWQGQAMGDAAIWLPLIFYALIRLRRSPSAAMIALAACAFALPVLAGHPETAAHLTIAGTALAMVLWALPGNARRTGFDAGFLGQFTAVGLLALGLASIQWIPTMEWLAEMPNRLETSWPTHPAYQALGLVSRDILSGPNSAGILVPNAAAYVGMVSLLLAPLGLFSGASRHIVWFFAVMTCAALAIAYSIGPMPWLVDLTPLKGLKNDRLILLGSFGIAALAGLGLSALEREQTSFAGRRRVLAVVLVVAAFAAAFILVYTLQQSTTFRVEFMRRPSFSRALLFVGMVPIVWRLLGGLRGRLFPAAVCLLAAFELATFSYGYTGWAEPHQIYPRSAVFDFLNQQDDPAQFRIGRLGTAYSVNSPMVYGLSSVDGYEILMDRPINFLRGLIEERMDAISLTGDGVFGPDERRIDMLNVKYLVVSIQDDEFQGLKEHSERYSQVFDNGHVAVFENKRALPRAYAVPATGIEIIADVPDILGRIKDPSFDPEATVILSGMPPPLPDQAPPGSFNSVVEMIESHINGYTFRVQVSDPAVLVVSQTYYPGWKATIDGKEAGVYEAYHALYGIPIPAGDHEVRFAYEPFTVKIGATLTLSSMILLAVLLLGRQRRQRAVY